ncbi:MAG: YciI family protein [Chloroflexi bacterium]|nr:YciI family protein [Chloroflexota bacterium]
MRYALLIYSDESTYMNLTPEEMEENMGRWFSYTNDLRESGKMLGGEALQPASTARIVRDASGAIASDGPFAETKEQLGGFYTIEADNDEEAAVWASKMPNIPDGGFVEIRQLREFE